MRLLYISKLRQIYSDSSSSSTRFDFRFVVFATTFFSTLTTLRVTFFVFVTLTDLLGETRESGRVNLAEVEVGFFDFDFPK